MLRLASTAHVRPQDKILLIGAFFNRIAASTPVAQLVYGDRLPYADDALWIACVCGAIRGDHLTQAPARR